MWLVRGCKSWAADTSEGAIGIDAACIDTEWGGCLSLITLVDVDTGHAGDVQAVAIETVTGKAFGNAHTAAMGTAIQDPALLSLQAFIGLSQGSCIASALRGLLRLWEGTTGVSGPIWPASASAGWSRSLRLTIGATIILEVRHVEGWGAIGGLPAGKGSRRGWVGVIG